jgi:2-oxoglutarate ferredoxin oxidoreductase subunit alpha
MNDWVVPKLEWDDSYAPDRGKVLSAEELEKLDKFYRYVDTDGDHIGYRSLPGVHPRGAYFARGSGHDRYGRYTEDSDAYVDVMDRLRAKVDSAADHLPQPDIRKAAGPTTLGIVSLGGCHWAVLEAIDDLAARGIHVDYLRVRAFPFSRSVEDFLASHDTIFVVEQNRDGQLRNLLALETDCVKDKMISVTYYGGQPLSKGHVLEGLAPHLEIKALMEVSS